MPDGRKAVWSIPYVSVAFFPNLKQNFIAYRSSSRPDCIFEIHQLWQSGFSRIYCNCCCSCSFEAEIIKISQPFYKMYCNKILNSQESTTILCVCTKKVWKLIECTTYLIYKVGLALNNLQWLICHKTKPNQTSIWTTDGTLTDTTTSVLSRPRNNVYNSQSPRTGVPPPDAVYTQKT